MGVHAYTISFGGGGENVLGLAGDPMWAKSELESHPHSLLIIPHPMHATLETLKGMYLYYENTTHVNGMMNSHKHPWGHSECDSVLH